MRFPLRVCIALLAIQLVLAACTRQQSGVTGTISPPTAGVRVIALQNGNIITTVDSSEHNGRFMLPLVPGTYDISIAAPKSPYPLIFQAIPVEPGKTTDLSTITLPSQTAGKSILSGRITPATAEARIALLSEGREMAVANADRNGNYIFTELPAGSYSLEARATNYVRDAVPVNIAQEGTMTENIALLYASSIDGVDWTTGKIRATGAGLPPAAAPNGTIRREMALRAALADARRKLVKAISEIKIGPDQSLKSQMGEKKFTQKIEGFIKGYKVVAERELNDGRIEIDVELPLTGQSGLSRYLVE